MQTEHNIRLTSAELAELWAAYMNDSMAICVLKYFLNKVEDTEIRPVIEYGLELSQSHVTKITKIFEGENFPIPVGFNEEEDVELNAPRLYSDTYFLQYVKQMGQLGMNAYSMAIATSTREDVYDYFSECFSQADKLHKMASRVLLSKGLYIRPPYIPTPTTPDFVKKQSFLTGWFGDRRPLTGLEISNLFANIQRNALGVATLIGFAQTAKIQEVKQFMQRGVDIAKKHVTIFGEVMKEDDLPVPMTWDTEVMDSTTFVFSDKLIMFQTTALIAIGIGYYGTSMSTSPRRDIGLHYTRLSTEIGQYAEDGANIMINNGWLEQPPTAADRQKLANV